jgi:hypothetical protein
LKNILIKKNFFEEVTCYTFLFLKAYPQMWEGRKEEKC